MRPRLLHVALPALAALSAVAGCDGSNTCTTEARASVSLTVLDAETGADVDAIVTFLLDGDGPRSPEEGWAGTYVLATELEGTYAVTIEAEGYETVMEEYEVTADECHVDSVRDTISMTPTP